MSHILNLASEVENKFEDDYNYKSVAMRDEPEFQLDKILEDCFDFIDDGRHYGNVLVHCSGTFGLSRSTAICIAYLMNKEKQKFSEAFNNVKEVRSFVKPNEGFVKQLKEYEVKLLGAQEAKDSGIDDPFAWRKKQEIEQEKAMVAGAASVKNRMKMFGATLDTGAASNRSKSVSPAPTPANASKWSASSQNNKPASATTTAKSMTPEPRKSWRTDANSTTTTATTNTATTTTNQPKIGGPPPPPPPMPANLLANEPASRSTKAGLPPPPPPPPPPVDSLAKDATTNKPPSAAAAASRQTNKTTAPIRKASVSESSDDDKKMVFGRRPPPPMKIRGGLSIERQDSTTSDKNQGLNKQ